MGLESGSIQECAYNRTYPVDVILRNPDLHGVLKLCGFSVVALAATALLFSVAQAYGKKYIQLGRNHFRLWFIRIFAGRFVRNESIDQERDAEVDEKTIKRNILVSKHTYSWFFKLTNYSDDDIDRLAGSDGLRYLRFAKKIVIILLVYSFCSPIVIGLHTLGGLGKGLPSLWAATTLANLEPGNDQLEIVHSFLGMMTLTVAIGAFVVYMYNNKLFGTNSLDETNPPALFIRGIAEADCTPVAVVGYLQENVGDRELRVKSVRLFKRNEARLENLCEELSIVSETLERLKIQPKEEQVRLAWFSDEKIEAQEYYVVKRRHIRDKIEETELDTAYTGSAIVYFETEEDTREAINGMGRFTKMVAVLPKFMSYFGYAWRGTCNPDDNPKKWLVSFAPPDEDIDLDNLVTHNPMRKRFMKVLMKIFIPVIMLLGASAPGPVIDVLHRYPLFRGFFAESVLLPGAQFAWNAGILVLVRLLATRSIAHCPLKSKKHEAAMHYVLYYLVLCDILMPLFNLTNMKDFFVWFTEFCHGKDSAWARVECLFREKIGVKLANSIIMSAFLRDIMLMLRLTHFMDIPPFKSSTKTEAEVRHRHKSVTPEVGYRYADFLYLYYMGVSVALTQPMVPYCAVISMFFRYWVDKHSLCHTYAKSLHTDKLHRHAIPLVFQPFILQSGTQLLFNYMRDAKFNEGVTSLPTTISLVYFVYVMIINTVSLIMEETIKLRRYRVEKPETDSE